MSLGYTWDTIQPCHSKITGVSGHNLPVLGKFYASLLVGNEIVKLPLIITESGPLVLGLDGLRTLKVQVVLNALADPPSSEISNLIKICNENKGGMRINPVQIEVSGDPVFLKARPVAFGLRAAVEKNLQNLVSDGILRPVESSTWGTPIVTPLKANGQPRICGDYRITVNPNLRRTPSITMEVEDMFAGLAGNTIFSKIDLTNAFLQVPLDESAKELTTINTMLGLFQYQYLPFGMNVSPGIFQRVVNDLISNLQGVRAYQDDLIVFGVNQEQHDQRLLQLLKVLAAKNVQINAKKSVF